MEDITTMLLIASIALYIVTILIPKRRELVWLTVFVSICSMGAILLDLTLRGEEVILLVIPDIFVLLMSLVKAMGLLEKW